MMRLHAPSDDIAKGLINPVDGRPATLPSHAHLDMEINNCLVFFDTAGWPAYCMLIDADTITPVGLVSAFVATKTHLKQHRDDEKIGIHHGMFLQTMVG